MTPQELKNSILQLAIQGKLVEQRPEEGTADELFREIQKEKNALVAAGKIKKEKPLPEISDDEIPFDIPESWRWVRVREVVTISPKNDIPDEKEVSFIPMALVEDGFRNSHSFQVKKWGEIKKGFAHFANGDVGVAKITPCFQNRKSVVFKDLVNGCGAGTTELTVSRPIGDFVLREYLLWFFKSEYFISNGVKSFTGTAGQQRIHKDYLANCSFPLPPLSEQKRIVSKLEELLPLCERYGEAWSKLEALEARFPGDLKKSLLQLAIQGKLVEQRPEEGTADELFREIQKEKNALVAAGKIKKEKPLPEISDDEIPFDIPESWRWVRLASVVRKLTDGSHNPPPNSGKGYPVISAKNVKNGVITLENVDRYTDERGFQKENLRTNIRRGDIIMGIIGGSIGNIAIYTHNERVIAQRSIAIMDFMIDVFYARTVLESPFIQNNLRKEAAGSAQGGVYLGTLNTLMLPLPPLSEQKRIVAKLEELLPLCDKLTGKQ